MSEDAAGAGDARVAAEADGAAVPVEAVEPPVEAVKPAEAVEPPAVEQEQAAPEPSPDSPAEPAASDLPPGTPSERPPGIPSERPPGLLPEGRRKRAWIVGVPTILAALLVAAGVAFASTTVFDAIGRTEAAPAPTRSSAPPLLTAEAYRQMLAAADVALAAPFQRFAAAAGPAALDSTATALAAAIDAETDRLSAVRPPEVATSAHEALVSGLSRLQWEPAGVDIEGRVDGASCTGAAGAASVARTEPAVQVRAAADRLKAADARFVFGSFLPAVTELQTRRMGNGTFLKRTSTDGSGLLKISNDGPKDTAVSLVAAGETAPRVTVYVTAKSAFTVRGLADGRYSVFTTAGVDWDPGMRAFSRDCEFTRFKDPLEFKTNHSSYTEWTITLSPSQSGNAPVEDVDADTYPTG